MPFNKTRDFLQYDTGQVINGQDKIKHSDKNLENAEENLLRRLFLDVENFSTS